MVNSRTVLGIGAIESPNEPPRSPMGIVADALKNPVHAALLAAGYLIYFLTTNVSATQKELADKLEAQTRAVTALVNAESAHATQERRAASLLTMICIGVNKTANAKEKCGDDR